MRSAFVYPLLSGALASLSAFVSKLLFARKPPSGWEHIALFVGYQVLVLLCLLLIEVFKMRSFLKALTVMKSWHCTILAFFANITFGVA